MRKIYEGKQTDWLKLPSEVSDNCWMLPFLYSLCAVHIKCPMLISGFWILKNCTYENTIDHSSYIALCRTVKSVWSFFFFWCLLILINIVKNLIVFTCVEVTCLDNGKDFLCIGAWHRCSGTCVSMYRIYVYTMYTNWCFSRYIHIQTPVVRAYRFSWSSMQYCRACLNFMLSWESWKRALNLPMHVNIACGEYLQFGLLLYTACTCSKSSGSSWTVTARTWFTASPPREVVDLKWPMSVTPG